jgi:hypothetical protein
MSFFHLCSYRRKVQEEDCPPLESRINALLKLEEVRAQAKRKLDQHQLIVKNWFDSNSASDRNFEVGDLVLKWDKPHEGKGEHTKFQNLWLGPFLIAEKLGPSSFQFLSPAEFRGTARHLPGEWPSSKKVFSLFLKVSFINKLFLDLDEGQHEKFFQGL